MSDGQEIVTELKRLVGAVDRLRLVLEAATGKKAPASKKTPARKGGKARRQLKVSF